MTKFAYWICSLFLYVCVSGKCNLHLPSLDYVVEHAVWRGWQQAIIYTMDQTSCKGEILRLVKCLGINGVATALNDNENVRFSTFLGIVILNPVLRRNETLRTTAIGTLTSREMNTASYDWLIVSKSVFDFKAINDILNKTAIRFDQNVVVTFSDIGTKQTKNRGLCDDNFVYKNKRKARIPIRNNINGNGSSSICNNHYNCKKTEYEKNYYKSTARLSNLTRIRMYQSVGKVVPLYRSGILFNSSRIFHPTNISDFSIYKEINVIRNRSLDYNIHIVQYFKVRFNSTLFITYLGAWSQNRSMSLVQSPFPREARNFMGEYFKVGRCNYSAESKSASDYDGPSAPELLDDVLQSLSLRLNATSVTKYYGKLGFRTYEGSWTGLLGALMDRSVDIALEPVTSISSHHSVMDFIFPISKTMCNIYIRHQETSAVRDIFLAPFSPGLIVCVFSVVFAAAIVLVLIDRVTAKLKDKEHMTCTEALIWATGILCQQGGSWTPANPSASILLIVCLLFALVIYNSYAAFITSVLSVRVASVGSVADVLQSSNFKIGYIKNSADQMYLMSTKDAQLNAFYIRGYSEAENLVTSAEEGLVRAAKQDYAFFAGQRIARSTLQSLSQARGRCGLRELPVHSTHAQLAFPLLRGSPYARPILVSLLKIYSSGVLERLETALVPGMPQCAPPSGFASARAADVKTALCVILAGLVASIILGVAEYCWKNRKDYRRRLQARIKIFH